MSETFKIRKGVACIWRHTRQRKVVTDISRLPEGFVGVKNSDPHHPVIWLKSEWLLPLDYLEQRRASIPQRASPTRATVRPSLLASREDEEDEEEEDTAPTFVAAPAGLCLHKRRAPAPPPPPVVRAPCSHAFRNRNQPCPRP